MSVSAPYLEAQNLPTCTGREELFKSALVKPVGKEESALVLVGQSNLWLHCQQSSGLQGINRIVFKEIRQNRISVKDLLSLTHSPDMVLEDVTEL